MWIESSAWMNQGNNAEKCRVKSFNLHFWKDGISDVLAVRDSKGESEG